MVPHYHGSTAKNRYIPTTKVDLNRSRHFKVDPISPFNFLSIDCGLIHWDSIPLKVALSRPEGYIDLFRFVSFRLKQTPLTHGSDRGCIRRPTVGP